MRTSISATSGHVRIFVKPAATSKRIKYGKKTPINLPASRSSFVPTNCAASKKKCRLTTFCCYLLKLILCGQPAVKENFFSIKYCVQSRTTNEWKLLILIMYRWKGSRIAIYTISVFQNVSLELLTPILPPASKIWKIIDFLRSQNNFNFQQIVTYQLTYLMR